MSSNVAVSVKNVSKTFRMYERPQDRLLQYFWGKKKPLFSEFHALTNVSFDIQKGETVALIGRNGSGKSTLLQIISGILQPTEGTVEVNGRVSALLELGSGFNPEFTGRENVYLNGAILGISRDEMESRFDQIVEFAEMEEFIDQPVKTYSSGMFVRLAFAVAINVDAEILIVDEALSVGDMRFQAKCIEKIKEFQKQGGTIIVVSHSLGAVRTMCTSCVWLDKGHIREIGAVNTVTSNYEFFIMQSSGNTIELIDVTDENNGDVYIKSVRSFSKNGENTSRFYTGDDIRLAIELENMLKEHRSISVGVAIFKENGQEISRINTSRDDLDLNVKPGNNTIELILEDIHLLTGTYYLSIFIGEANMRYTISKWEWAAKLHIETQFALNGMRQYDGLFKLKHVWNQH